MRASLAGLAFAVAVVVGYPLFTTAAAADPADAALVQAQAPNLLRLPQDLFKPPQPPQPQNPQVLPDWSQRRPFELQRQGAVAYCGHIRVIPADPSIDPKFIIRPRPNAPVIPQRRPVAPPMPACEYEGGAPRMPAPAPAPVAPR